MVYGYWHLVFFFLDVIVFYICWHLICCFDLWISTSSVFCISFNYLFIFLYIPLGYEVTPYTMKRKAPSNFENLNLEVQDFIIKYGNSVVFLRINHSKSLHFCNKISNRYSQFYLTQLGLYFGKFVAIRSFPLIVL